MAIDLRSDTVTKPTDEMRKAMYEAEVGDDVYGEDPTVNKLQEVAAEMLGKEAALFVTSGTQGNQLAVLAQARPGEEIILEADSHIFMYEAAAQSAFAGVQTRTLPGMRGQMNPDEVEKAIRTYNVHHPRTALICLENTHNRAGGTVLPVEHMRRMYEVAQKHEVPVHLDGARLFNAVVAIQGKATDFTQYVDTVQVCFSKGLGAPVGSILAGDKDTIHRAYLWRKRLGGGMRQAGVIAAPALLALTTMVDRLAEDQANAQTLARGLAEIDGIEIDLATVETNIVICNVKGTGMSELAFLEALEQEGVRAVDFGPDLVRFVTHKDVSEADIRTAIDRVARVARGNR
ncbi:MAG TPA: GntG family PLP-dependent aldolase [Bacilli bacterium]|nr:GntG family PLP-dependent aldolase [Bacilli bacterium]